MISFSILYHILSYENISYYIIFCFIIERHNILSFLYYIMFFFYYIVLYYKKYAVLYAFALFFIAPFYCIVLYDFVLY